MKIAILGARGYPSTYSGYETLVRRLAPFLAAAGDEVTVYDRDRSRAGMTDGINVRTSIGLASKSTSTLSHGLTSALDASRRGYDAALVVNIANGLWLPILRRAGIPTVVNVDGLEWERGKWNALGKKVFRFAADMTARQADALVTDSLAIGKYWSQHMGVDAEYIPYGADVLSATGFDKGEKLGLRPGSYVLAVSRLVPENNLEMLLDAVTSFPHDLPVVVVGSAMGRSSLADRLESLATSGRVQWLGHVSDQGLLDQLWRHCGLCFHGHSVGGTNPSLLQALGAGSPVVVFDTPYNKEVVGDSWPSFQDEEDVLALLSAFRADPHCFDDLRLRGPEIVAARFSWSEVCASYRSILSRVASERDGQP